MKKSNIIFSILFILSILFNIFVIIYKINNIRYVDVVKSDTIVQVDTIVDTLPRLIDRVVLPPMIDTIQIIIEGDTVEREAIIPMEQKTYSDDSTYTAWVSGFNPNLDSIQVYNKEIIINTETIKYKEKKGVKIKPSINVGYGYGIFNRKSDLYVGIGGSITF